MVEIAKAVERHPTAGSAFDIQFISDGGDFEGLIEKHGFPLTRMEPRLTKEKIEHIAKVDRGEKFAPAFTDREMIQRVDNEIACLKQLTPAAVVTGSYMTIPISCRVLRHPPRLGHSVDLASRLLSPWRRHDRSHQARSAESGRRLVRDAIH